MSGATALPSDGTYRAVGSGGSRAWDLDSRRPRQLVFSRRLLGILLVLQCVAAQPSWAQSPPEPIQNSPYLDPVEKFYQRLGLKCENWDKYPEKTNADPKRLSEFIEKYHQWNLHGTDQFLMFDLILASFRKLVENGAPARKIRQFEGEILRIYRTNPQDLRLAVKEYDSENNPLQDFAKRLLAEPSLEK